MDTKIKELIEETRQAVADINTRNEALEADGKKNSEGMEELKTNFVELTEKLDAINAAAEAEQKAREELELVMARGAQTKDGEIVADPEYKQAFGSYLRYKTPIDSEIAEKALDQLIEQQEYKTERSVAEMKTLLVGSNPDGGYLVPVDVRTEIQKRLFELSPMRSLATTITTARDKVEYPIDDDLGLYCYWASELDERTETDTPKLGVLDFPTEELIAEPSITLKAVEDSSINLEQWLQNKVTDMFARKESTSFITGTGDKQIRGFMSYPVTGVETYQRGSLGERETSINDDHSADDYIDLQTNLLEQYQGNASWMMNRQIFAAIAKLKTTDGDYLLNPRILFEGRQMQLLGRPVNFSPDMATSIANGNRIVAYGDFRSGYLIVDRIGINVLRDPYTDKRFVKYFTRKRVGGGVINFQAIKTMRVQ